MGFFNERRKTKDLKIQTFIDMHIHAYKMKLCKVPEAPTVCVEWPGLSKGMAVEKFRDLCK